MRDLLMIFGTMLLMFAVAVFVAWRFEVRERREQEKRERAPTA
jgi:Sec-independent protein secretion pathway component TatC